MATECRSLFQPLLEGEILQILKEKTVEAECQLYLGAIGTSSTLTDKSEPEAVVLQIIEDWVVQLTPDRVKMVSGFRCDYEIQFEILRKMSQVLLLLA